ncbi:MAG: hypothetical protein AAFX06_23630 [Planctomycetota bacterium]
MGLPDDVEIALTPSGTDAELLAVALADRDPDRPIFNLIIGPDEVGSGTVRAASGLHYDARVPHGGSAVQGSPVDRQLENRIQVHSVDVRDARGLPRTPTDLDTEVQQLVSQAVADGYQVLLHAVAHSKTGVFAPRLETLQRIQSQLSSDVTVIVDAAQGRLGSAFGTVAFADLVRQGWIINFTGSKFFSGPPFSAALIVPRSLKVSRRTRGLPPTFGNYFSRAEMPKSWTAIRQSMDSWINVPAIARWTAAVAEIQAFQSVAPLERAAIMQSFAHSAVEHLSARSGLSVLPAFEQQQSDWVTTQDGYAPTVISFSVQSSESFGRKALSTIHRSLNQLEPMPIQLGQPVQISPGNWVLRVALGAPLLVRVAKDASLGDDLTTRLNWLDDTLRNVAQEVESLAASTLLNETDVAVIAN